MKVKEKWSKEYIEKYNHEHRNKRFPIQGTDALEEAWLAGFEFAKDKLHYQVGLYNNERAESVIPDFGNEEYTENTLD